MPQLDTTTFFTQSFWLIIVFIFAYLAITNYFIIDLASIIKSREKYLDIRNFTLKVYANEIDIYSTYNRTLISQKTLLKNLLNSFKTNLDQFYSTSLISIKNSSTNAMNIYLETKYSIIIDLLIANTPLVDELQDSLDDSTD